ncbi:MAG: hypothetical protein GWN17_07920 [Candidatus Korarchaeota archaeon]|nr:hypothetical protein [Candidatus Korarchaeota archaeon]
MSLRDYPYVPEVDDERPTPVVCVCYGCKHLVASPIFCNHPESCVVRFDWVREFTYKLPSVEMCCRSGNRCTYYEPDTKKSADFDEKGKAKDEKIKNLIKTMREKRVMKDKDEEEKPKE